MTTVRSSPTSRAVPDLFPTSARPRARSGAPEPNLPDLFGVARVWRSVGPCIRSLTHTCRLGRLGRLGNASSHAASVVADLVPTSTGRACVQVPRESGVDPMHADLSFSHRGTRGVKHGSSLEGALLRAARPQFARSFCGISLVKVLPLHLKGCGKGVK